MKTLLTRILDYMSAQGYELSTGRGEVNIVYVEGCYEDGTLNSDDLDGWNDLRLVIMYDADGQAYIAHSAIATADPRYQKRKNFLFSTTLIPGHKLPPA